MIEGFDLCFLEPVRAILWENSLGGVDRRSDLPGLVFNLVPPEVQLATCA